MRAEWNTSAGPYSPLLPARGCPLLERLIWRVYLIRMASLVSRLARPLISPLFADLRGLPPILLQAGGSDLLLSDARSFAGRARAAGGDATLEVYEEMRHVWQIFVPYLPEARQAVASIDRFVRVHSRSPEAAAHLGRR